MRIARFTTGGDPRYAIVDGGELAVLTGDPLYMSVQPTGEQVSLDRDDLRLLAPVIPRSKVIGVGRNYADHAKEMGNETPVVPMLFLKPNTAVIGPDDPIVLPSWSAEVHHEAELAVVIGKVTKSVSAERALERVFGFTVANDVTARDVQRAEKLWTRAKGFDGSCPLDVPCCHVVGHREAEHPLQRTLGRDALGDLADHDRELCLVLHLGRPARQHDGVVRPDHGGVRLEEEHRDHWGLVAHLLGVVGVGRNYADHAK